MAEIARAAKEGLLALAVGTGLAMPARHTVPNPVVVENSATGCDL
jgi:hypothetical protein